MKYNESGNINDHILEFDKTVRELKATLENLDIVSNLLLTLPTSYDTLVTALETMKPEDRSLEFVKGRLLDEDAKRNGGNGRENQKPNGCEGVAMTVKKCYNYKMFQLW